MRILTLLLAGAAFSPTAFAQSFTIAGTCGTGSTMDFSMSGLTPGGDDAVVSATGTGTALVPVGVCAGTTLDLDPTSLTLRRLAIADATGADGFTPQVPTPACGNHYAQVIHLTTCTVSNVELVDTPPPSTGEFLINERNASTVWAWNPTTGSLVIDHTGMENNDVDCNTTEGLDFGVAAEHFDDELPSFAPISGSGFTVLNTNVGYASPSTSRSTRTPSSSPIATAPSSASTPPTGSRCSSRTPWAPPRARAWP